MPSGPVTCKAWIEMIHRYLAMAVGVLILVMAVASWARAPARCRSRPGGPTLTLVWVCVQGAVRRVTVT